MYEITKLKRQFSDTLIENGLLSPKDDYDEYSEVKGSQTSGKELLTDACYVTSPAVPTL